MMDKITALSVPPGNSLTDAPGKWAWERPALYPDPDDAIDHIANMVTTQPLRDDMLKLMMAGISIEELVNQISFKGFLEGAYTPDVAEITKPAVAIILADLAIQAGFEPKMFVESKVPEGNVDDETFFRLLKKNNPELFSGMVEELNKQVREGSKGMKELDESIRQDTSKKERIQSESFLADREK